MNKTTYELIKYYDEVSKDNIRNDEEVIEFTDELYKKITKVSNFKFNEKIIYKILHPVKTLKNYNEYSRLKKIENNFNNLVEKNVMYFNNDEFADLDKDLNETAKYLKPNAVKKYIKSISLK